MGVLSFLSLYVFSILLYFFAKFSPPGSALSSCKLRRKFHLNSMHKPGDVILGGLFEVHYTSVFSELTFTSEPNKHICHG